MNALQAWIDDSDWDWIPAMNALQDAGVISDEAVTVSDVVDAVDQQKAIAFLESKTL